MKNLILILSTIFIANLAFADSSDLFDSEEYYDCKTTEGTEFSIYLNHVRVTMVEIEAFGNTFYGKENWWSKEINAKANNANIYEPETINIKKNRLGHFYHMTVNHKNGRAPWVLKVSCIKK